MTLPTIHVKDIPEDGLTVDAPLTEAWMRGALADTGIDPVGDPAGKTRLRLDKSGRNVLLSGTVDARVRTHCVRCLEPVELPVHAEFALNLEPAAAPRREREGGREEVDLRAEELDVDVYENDRIELGHWVREQLLLEAPAYPACEAGCNTPLVSPDAKVIAEEAEAIDPRLAPLKKLSKKE